MKPDELMYIYNFIDTDKDGKLDYKEISDVLRGRKTINAAEAISKRRAEQGLDHGYTPSEFAFIQKGSKQVSFDKDEARSVGQTVSGMSTLMKRSDMEAREVPPLTDPDEHRRNLTEIKETILAKAFSFEDVISKMNVGKPGALYKVSFEDFWKVVSFYCGRSRFSGHQVKTAFKEICSNLENADQSTLNGAFIYMRDFKDRFFPGRTWNPDVDSRSDEKKRMAEIGDNSSVTSQSVHISTIMQGRTNADIQMDKDAAERKQLMED